MIRHEQEQTARALCDGCPKQSPRFPTELALLLAMPQFGWHDIGHGFTRRGQPFRHLCGACFASWRTAADGKAPTAGEIVDAVEVQP